jgi:tripartite ATP-independent transporter DctM subunit
MTTSVQIAVAALPPAKARRWRLVSRDNRQLLPMRWLAGALSVVLSAALLTMFVVVFGNVVRRNITGESWLWQPEITTLALNVLTFCGGAVAYRRGRHASVAGLARFIPDRYETALAAFGDGAVLLVALMVAWVAQPLISQESSFRTPILGLSQSWNVAILIAGMLALAVFAVERLVFYSRHDLLLAAAGLAVLAGLECLMVEAAGQLDTRALVYPALATVVVLLFCGVPIAFVLAASGELYIFYTGSVPKTTGAINMSAATNSFVLVAIPFFILAGLLMTHAGLSARLASVAEAALTRVPGSLQHVVVVTMYLFSGLSGSKIADVAAVGSTMDGPMRAAGYPPSETAAVLSASAIMGESIPPSVIMLVLSSITSLSVAGLFAAGILPAAFIALLLMGWIFWSALRHPVQAPTAFSLKRLVVSAVKAVPALAVPVVLIAGIVTGAASPTETSAVAVAIAVVAGLLLRGLTAKAAWNSLIDTSVTVGMVLLIVSAASNFAWTVSVSGIATDVEHLAANLGNKYLFMLATMIILPIFGTLLEGLPAVLILGPLMVPAAISLGIAPLQYAVVFVIAMGLGTFAPPIGVGFYTACATVNAPLRETAKRLRKYWLVIFAGLIVIAAVPSVSLWLPHYLNL